MVTRHIDGELLITRVLNAELDLSDYQDWPQDWTTILTLKPEGESRTLKFSLPFRLYAEGELIFTREKGSPPISREEITSDDYIYAFYIAERHGAVFDFYSEDIRLLSEARKNKTETRIKGSIKTYH